MKKAFHLISLDNWQNDLYRMKQRYLVWLGSCSDSLKKSYHGGNVTVVMDNKLLTESRRFDAITQVLDDDMQGTWFLYPVEWSQTSLMQVFTLAYLVDHRETSPSIIHLDNEIRYFISIMHPAYPVKTISDPSISLIMACFSSLQDMVYFVLEKGPDALFETCGIDKIESHAVFYYLYEVPLKKLELVFPLNKA